MKRQSQGFSSLIRHPLLIAILLYVPLSTMEWRGKQSLFLLEPLAFALDSTPQNQKPHPLLKHQEKIAELREANELLRQAYTQLKDFEINYPQSFEQLNPIPARIIMRGDSSHWRRTVHINRGSQHAIKRGYPVTIGKHLIGQVIAVTPHISVVELITDPNFRAPVDLLPRSAFPNRLKERKHSTKTQTHVKMGTSRGILRGNASTTPRIPRLAVSDIDPEAQLEEGMLVMTNERGHKFPAGLLVGEVKEVSEKEAFFEVSIESFVDLAQNDLVLVLPHEPLNLGKSAQLFLREKNS